MIIPDLRPYATMKSSGAEWLGDVPEHWDVQPLGRIGSFFKGRGGTKDDEVEEGVPCVRYGDLYMRHRFFINESRARIAPQVAKAKYTPIRYGDILFAGSGETLAEIGKSAVNLIRGSAYCGGDVIICRPSIDANARFLAYAADCPASVHQKACFGRGLTVMHIYSRDLKHMAVAIPPRPEQAAIVRFLDHVNRRIQRYIRGKERLIELLDEQKHAIIHQAVTGQIDVRTRRPYPTYWESGVEWLGEVPKQWEVRRLRNVGKAITGLTYAPQDVGDGEDGVLVLRASNISEGQIVDADNVFVRCSIPSQLITRTGDILICSRSGSKTLIGKSARIDSTSSGVTFGAFMTIFRCANNDYLYFVFNSRLFEYQSGAFLTSTINQLTLGMLYGIKIPFPPHAEQQQIIQYLARATRILNEAITRSRRQIELLREYRIRLIADVVTGKLDVREAAAVLPDVDSLAIGRTRGTTPESGAAPEAFVEHARR